LLRPTQSLALAMQQIGRGLRPAPGKEHLVVIDHAGNCLRHGLPELPRQWTLDGAPKALEGAQWRCPACGCLNVLARLTCASCSADKPGRAPPGVGGGRKIPEVSEGALIELSLRQAEIERLRRIPYRQFVAGRWSKRKIDLYKQLRGYKPGWAFYRWKEQCEREREGASYGRA
jgi:hypothetical protein